ELELAPGTAWSLGWVHALGVSPGETKERMANYRATFDVRVEQARRAWELEWEAAFTPGNDRFSGHRPVLESGDQRLTKLYAMAIATVLYCKRTVQMGGRALVYATGLPSTRFTFSVTSAFLW